MTSSRKQTPHRGVSKVGKRQVTIHLTPDDYERLRTLAESQERSVAAQARWIFAEALALVDMAGQIGDDQEPQTKGDD